MCMMIKDKYIDPFTDFGFKRIFGTEENKRFLISFLNDLLDIEDNIVDIEYRNLEKLGLNVVDRKAIFDVYCTDEKNNNFIVELQRGKQKYFKDRSIYYTSFPIQEQSKKGDWDYEYWLYYLSHLAKCQSIPKALEKDELIKDAFNVAEFLALSKDEQFAYQLDLKAKLDYKNVLDYAKEEAEKIGMEKGIKERNLEIAKSLLDILDVEIIALKTGLTVTEVQRLKDDK
jgi:hypothetical protein